jgi:hypothetical protein
MQVWKINLRWQQNLSIIGNNNTLVKSAAKYLMHGKIYTYIKLKTILTDNSHLYYQLIFNNSKR